MSDQGQSKVARDVINWVHGARIGARDAGEEFPQDGSLRSSSERKETSVLWSNLAQVLSFESITRPVAMVSVK